MMLFATTLFGQYSRTDAIDLVLNTILADDVGNVDVYCSFDTKTTTVDLIDNDTRSNPFSESWVFFSNDNPFASWYHNSRLIFVSAVDGGYTIADVEIYPKGLSSGFEGISMASRPAPIAMDGNAFVPDPEKVLSNYNHALIVVAMDEYRNWYNTSLIYNVLLQNYNYQKDNITVLYNYDGHCYLQGIDDGDLDGNTFQDDIDGPATHAYIQTTITNLTNSLGHGDQLAVFFTGVPVNTNFSEPRFGFPIDANTIINYPVSDFSTVLKNIACGQMILNFDVNSAEEVASYFEATGTNALCQNRYLTASCATDEENHAEGYFSGYNYSEQLFYWASAARGYLPKTDEPWLYYPTAIGFENGGGFPYNTIQGLETHPGDNTLDDNGDGFVQMREAFQYADDMNTWTTAYFFLPPSPSVESQLPAQTDELPFADDLLTMAGLSGKLEHAPANLPERAYIVADELELQASQTLTFPDNSKIFIYANQLEGNAHITTLGGSSLILGQNVEVTGIDMDGVELSGININGDVFTVGQNSTFTNIDLDIPNGINSFVLDNVTWEEGEITLYKCSDIDIGHSVFTRVGINGTRINNAQVYSNLFTSSQISVGGDVLGSASLGITIEDNTFNGYHPQSTLTTVNITDFNDFNISNNDLIACVGANLHNVGWGKQHIFAHNKISGCYTDGLEILDSQANLSFNEIIGNQSNGLALYNHCNILLKGNSAANTVGETQRFIDNASQGGQEIQTDIQSFPVYFKYNAILKTDGIEETDRFILCFDNPFTYNDVRNNYWGYDQAGNEITDPSPYLLPTNGYLWDPVFDLNYDGGSITGAEALYETGQQQFADDNFSGAKTTFLQVVAQYPETHHASASLKGLYALEQYATNDYSGLKQYYLTDQTILSDSILNALGGFLANKCDVKMENYPTAIDWYEDRIQAPPSFADSIYSIIDLGHTYLLMESGGNKSSSYIGSMPEHKPENHVAHRQTTTYLLSLLHGTQDNMSEELKDNLNSLKAGELLQNIPNPFNGSTNIYYKLEADANVAIKIFNSMGQIIKTIDEGVKEKGTYSTHFNAGGLVNGMYFYTIQVNGKQTDTKKMNLIR